MNPDINFICGSIMEDGFPPR